MSTAPRQRGRPMLAALGAFAAAVGTALGGPGERTWTDAAGDAVLRRTDTGNDGPLGPATVLPDVVSLTASSWAPYAPSSDLYSGVVVNPDAAHFIRVDLVLDGLVNPPGTVGHAGLPFLPFEFGASPLYGFVDLDVDNRKDSGGELGSAANVRYLANVGRFGRVPEGSFGERAAESAADLDLNFSTHPQVERTGADFALVFCGCWTVTIVTQNGDLDGVFDEGETWTVRGRFFQRSAGYKLASGAFGGSAFGLYDPWWNVRFAHDPAADRTTVTCVFPLDMTGAAQAANAPQQPPDLNVGNHTSIEEALLDIIARADLATGPTEELVRDWRGREPEDSEDPSEWDATVLLGTSYGEPQDSYYAWTDTGFSETPADLNGDHLANDLDQARFRDFVYSTDGLPGDADGYKNGVFVLENPGPNFSLYDLNGDARADQEDLWAYGHRADLDGSGDLNFFDFIAYQDLFSVGDMKADFDLDQWLSFFDFIAYQDAFSR